MNAYRNNPDLKALIVELSSRAADFFDVKGISPLTKSSVQRFDIGQFENFQQCRLFEQEFEIPAQLFFVAQAISREFTPDAARAWSKNFYANCRVGADLSRVWAKFAAWLLTDSRDGATAFAHSDEQHKALCELSKLLHPRLTDEARRSAALSNILVSFNGNTGSTSFEMARSIHWSMIPLNPTRQAENSVDALAQSAFGHYRQCSNYKAYESLRRGAYLRQSEWFLKILATM